MTPEQRETLDFILNDLYFKFIFLPRYYVGRIRDWVLRRG